MKIDRVVYPESTDSFQSYFSGGSRHFQFAYAFVNFCSNVVNALFPITLLHNDKCSSYYHFCGIIINAHFRTRHSIIANAPFSINFVVIFVAHFSF